MVYDLYRRRPVSLNDDEDKLGDWTDAAFALRSPRAAEGTSDNLPAEAEAGRAAGPDAAAEVAATKARLQYLVDDPDYWRHHKPDAVARATKAFEAAYGAGAGVDAAGKLIRTDPKPIDFAAFEPPKEEEFGVDASTSGRTAAALHDFMADDRSGADDRARAQGFLPRVPATSGQAKPPHRNLLDRQDGRNLEIQDLLYRPDRDKPSVVPAQAVPDRPSWPPRDHRRNQDVPAEPPIKWQSPMIGPVRISRELGIQTHPILGRRRGHSGIDIVAPIGTYLYAAGRGTVERLANDTRMENGKTVGYGNYIIIRHDDGRRSLYAHLSEYGPWKVGDRLTDDDAAHVPIGRVGVSGGVTGPHLHFEMWDEEDWNKRNPYDPRKVIPQLAEQDRRWRLDEARRAGNEPRQTLPHFGGPR